MPELTYNIVYKITNLVNNKIYVGVHKTNDLDDGYMGSGTVMRKALTKYGNENFKKEILFNFSTYKEALEKEKEIVDDDFLKRKDVYNQRRGGDGGFDYINKQPEKSLWVRKGAYAGGRKTAIRNHNLALKKYKNNPKHCKFCAEIIPFSRKENQFCNHSCSAKYNNLKRRRLKYIIRVYQSDIDKETYAKNPKLCPYCGSVIPFSKRKKIIFCSKSCKTKQQHREQPDLRFSNKFGYNGH